MHDAYIFDHVRTPRGKGRATGALASVTPMDLLGQTLIALKNRSQLDTALVEDIIAGCGSPVGEQGSAVGRAASLYAGFAVTTPGQQINRFCSSGLEAVNLAAAKVMAGQCDLLIGCGVESMSRIPIGSSGGAWSSDPALAYKINYVPQGISADLVATLGGFSRHDVDEYAVESQRRAGYAWDQGYFNNSVITVRDEIGMPLLSRDEHMRPGTSLEDLARLPAVFEAMGGVGFDEQAMFKYPHVEKINHVHTAGNSSGIVDGAAAALIGNRETADALGLKPRARIRSFASVGTDPTTMLTGPTPSALQALKKAGMDKHHQCHCLKYQFQER